MMNKTELYSKILNYADCAYSLFEVKRASNGITCDFNILEFNEKFRELFDIPPISNSNNFSACHISHDFVSFLLQIAPTSAEPSPGIKNKLLLTYNKKQIEAITFQTGAQQFAGLFKDVTYSSSEILTFGSDTNKTNPILKNFFGIVYQVSSENLNVSFIEGIVSEVTGYRQEDFLSGRLSWIDIIHSDDKQKVLTQIKLLQKDDQHSSDIIYRIVNKNGAIKWVRDISKNVIIESDRKNLIQGTVYDITEKVHARESLKQSKARYHLLFDQSPVGIFIYDTSLRITDCNNRFVEILKADKEKLIGLDMHILQDKSVLPSIEHALTGKNGYYEGLYKATIGNAIVWISLRTTPVYGPEDKITGGIGIVEDITERIETENALRSSEEKFRLITENIRDVVIKLDTHGNYLYISPSHSEVLGRGLEVLGKNSFEFIHTDDHHELLKIFKEGLRSRKEKKAEFRYLHPEKGYIWIEAVGKVTKDLHGNEFFLYTAREISDRKAAERAVAESEVKYRKIFETSPLGLVMTDSEGIIQLANKNAAALYGFDDPDLLKGKNSFGFILQEDLVRYYEYHNSLLHFGNALNIEVKFKKKDGSSVPVEVNAAVIINSDGAITSILSTLKDLTEQKKAEKDLIFRFEFEKTLTGISSHFINISLDNFESEIDNALETIGKFFDVDRSYLFTISDDQKLMSNTNEWCKDGIRQQKDALQGVPLDSLPWWAAALRESDTIHIPKVSDLPSEAEKERKIFEAQEIKSLVCVPMKMGGSTLGFLGFDSVTIQREWSEESIAMLQIAGHSIASALLQRKEDLAIRRNEERLRQVIGTMPVLLNAFDADGNIIFWNEECVRVTGYTAEEMINNPNALHYLYPDEEYRATVLEVIRESNGKYYNREFELTCKDGTKRIILWSNVSKKFHIPGWEHWGVGVDQTERKKLIADLVHAKEKAEEANLIKSNFLANMSHELRTPMIGILGYSEMMIEEDVDEYIKETARTINEGGKRLLNTLNLILDLSRLEKNQFETFYSVDSVNKVINETVELFTPFAVKKNLQLKLNLPDEEIKVRLDHRLLREIITNIINNALKFTNEGSITITAHVEANQLVIKVKDTGIGIPEDKLSLIFEEFRQASEGLNRSFDGTGLGLTITKKFVELMNGSILVSSKVGVGSEFSIILPAEFPWEMESLTNDTSHNDESQPDISLPYEEALVLLVEDDELNAKAIEKLISVQHKVETINTASGALEKISRKKYSIILMDINLGTGKTGIDILKEIRLMPRCANTPVIAVTAFAMKGDKEEFLEAGFDDYIAKPFGRKEILNLINKHLSVTCTK